MRAIQVIKWTAVIWTALLAMLAIGLSGCAPTISPAAQQQIQQLKDQQAIGMQNLQDAQAKSLTTLNETLKENAAKGKSSPVSNPIDATNSTVGELHPWLLYGSIFLFVLAVLCLGLSAIGPYAGSVPWLAWLKPVGQIAQVAEPCSVRSFCVVFASLMLLPFLKVSVICAVISLVVLFIYEMVINKGNLQTVISSMVKLATGGIGSPVSISNVSSGLIK